MKFTFQLALAVLIGAGTIYPGVFSFLAPAGLVEKYFGIDIAYYDTELQLAIEVQFRLLAGMWITAGVAILAVTPNFEQHTVLIRVVLAGLGIGAAGQMLALQSVLGNVMTVLPNALFTIFVCVAMECWRWWLVRRMQRNILA